MEKYVIILRTNAHTECDEQSEKPGGVSFSLFWPHRECKVAGSDFEGSTDQQSAVYVPKQAAKNRFTIRQMRK